MTLKNDENQKVKYLDLLYAPGSLDQFGQIDKQSGKIAESLDKDRSIYHSYAILDSLSSSYSMFKYFFDIFNPNSDNDAMHDAMLSTSGIIGITVESLFLVSFSLIASVYEKDKVPKKQIESEQAEQEETEKKTDPDWFWFQISEAWPYFRTVMKGLKNAYKGWRSAIIAAGLLSGLDIKYLIAPVGIILGVFAAINRIWLQYMIDLRKDMMKANKRELDELRGKHLTEEHARERKPLTNEEARQRSKKIQYQSEETRIIAYLAVTAGSLIDSLYLYVGVLGLASVSFPLLSYLSAVCAFYTVACIVSRIYEEYDYQERLFISQTKCKLEITAHQLETSYAKLLSMYNASYEEADVDPIYLRAEIHALLGRFAAERKLLIKHYSRSNFSAAIIGIKNGLYAYGALASMLFLTATLLTMAGVNFPPALLVFTVSLGLVFIAGFFAHTLILNNQFLNKEKNVDAQPSYEKLLAMKGKIKQNPLDVEGLIDQQSMRQLLTKSVDEVEPPPRFLFQESFEVVRSTFSGIGKGQKFVDFAGNVLQEKDEQGHYHSSKLMAVFSLFSSLVFGVVLGVRALARGFGRPPLGQVAKDTEVPVTVVEPTPSTPPITKPDVWTPIDNPVRLVGKKNGFNEPLYPKIEKPISITPKRQPNKITVFQTPPVPAKYKERPLNSGLPSSLGLFAHQEETKTFNSAQEQLYVPGTKFFERKPKVATGIHYSSSEVSLASKDTNSGGIIQGLG